MPWPSRDWTDPQASIGFNVCVRPCPPTDARACSVRAEPLAELPQDDASPGRRVPKGCGPPTITGKRSVGTPPWAQVPGASSAGGAHSVSPLDARRLLAGRQGQGVGRRRRIHAHLPHPHRRVQPLAMPSVMPTFTWRPRCLLLPLAILIALSATAATGRRDSLDPNALLWRAAARRLALSRSPPGRAGRGGGHVRLSGATGSMRA
jgi:hypothetical protein